MKLDADYETRPFVGGRRDGELGPSGGYQYHDYEYHLETIAFVKRNSDELTLCTRAFWRASELPKDKSRLMAAKHFGWDITCGAES